jgi:hypothetical protein
MRLAPWTAAAAAEEEPAVTTAAAAASQAPAESCGMPEALWHPALLSKPDVQKVVTGLTRIRSMLLGEANGQSKSCVF